MNITRIPALVLLFIALSFGAAAQQDTSALTTIIEKTQRFAAEYPPEKVYLHFDKPYYAVGDTVWFKGYVTQGQNQPSVLSKILYVDVYSTTDSLVQSFKLPVTDGAAYGNFPISKDHYKQGNYYIRSYTLWMLNFDNAYFFYKNMVIGEAIDRQVLTSIKFTGAPDKMNARIQFKDPAGKPYASKQVNWQIFTGYDEVARGKVTTDAGGFAVIQIPGDAKKTPITDASRLVAGLQAVDKDPPVYSSFTLKNLKTTNDLQFFPEGGEFIAGIPTQIAFKSISSSGLGINLKGVLKDNDGNKVMDFTSQHLGMGAFYVNADISKTYKVEVTFADGTTGKFDLPKPAASGITIQANSKIPASVDVRVIASENYVNDNKGKTYSIVAQQNGIVYFAGKAVLQKQLILFKIPKSKLPEGILQLTLFSPSKDPLSERLVFIKNKSHLNLDIKTDKPAYNIKQKVTLSISAKDSTNFVPSFLSLSVVDETKVPVNEQDETTILSTLLLTSDLKGYIEKPNYYFVKTDDKKLADLDILLLTQGYRRFSYKDILQNRYPETAFQPEQGITITGTLRNKTGLPINKGTLLMTIPSKRYNKQLLTSAMGEFAFRDLVFTDSSQVTISAKYNPNPNSLLVMLDGLPEAGSGKNKNMADDITNIDSAINNYLENSRKQYRGLRTIKEVVITSNANKAKRPSHSDHPQTSMLSSIPDHLIEGENFKGCTYLAECIKFRLTGVTYYEGNFYVTRDYNMGKKIPMAIFINGVLMDYNSINTVLPQDLESIEIFFKDVLGTIDRNYNTSGVIVINTKAPVKNLKGGKVTKDDLKKLIPENYIISYFPKGYIREREFYVPKYSPDPTANNFADLRTTVYWNPKIKTDVNGVTTVEFFNADGKGNYRAVLEGNDAHGNVARTVVRYQVK